LPAQASDFKNLLNLRTDVAQDEPAADGAGLPVHGDELAKKGAGQVLDVREVQEHLLAAQLVHQAEQLLADALSRWLAEDLLAREIDDGDIADVLDAERLTMPEHEEKPY
jgi:hypothetical protein